MRFHVVERVVHLLNSSANGARNHRRRVSSFRTFTISVTDHMKANGLTKITATVALNNPNTIF